jgi:hypothetical protein
VARGAKVLRRHLPAIRAHLEPLNAPWASVLTEYLQHSLDAAAGRGDGAVQSSKARSAAIRGGIRRAVGALPADAWGVAGVVLRRIANKGPARYGLERVPDVETIRATLREMAEERNLRVSESESTHPHG